MTLQEFREYKKTGCCKYTLSNTKIKLFDEINDEKTYLLIEKYNTINVTFGVLYGFVLGIIFGFALALL